MWLSDSSEYVCIENCNISTGYDAIVLKSGWDEYGIAYAKPTRNVHIRGVNLQSSLGSGLAFGSEMSGGISTILAEQLKIHNSFLGIDLKTTRGRGGYMKDISISNVEMENVNLAIRATGQSGSHPDDKFDPDALPVVRKITFENMVGKNITVSGNFSGIYESPFESICLSNISFSITSNSSTSWFCSNVMGFSREVSPRPCPNLQESFPKTSSICYSLIYPYTHSTVLWDHKMDKYAFVWFNLHIRYYLAYSFTLQVLGIFPIKFRFLESNLLIICTCTASLPFVYPKRKRKKNSYNMTVDDWHRVVVSWKYIMGLCLLICLRCYNKKERALPPLKLLMLNE